MSYSSWFTNEIDSVKETHRFKVGDVVRLKPDIVSGRYNNDGLMSEDDYSPFVSVDSKFIIRYKDKPITINRVWTHNSGALCYDVNIYGEGFARLLESEKVLLDSMLQPYDRKEVLL